KCAGNLRSGHRARVRPGPARAVRCPADRPRNPAGRRRFGPDGARSRPIETPVMKQEGHEKGVAMKRKLFEYGGIASSVILILVGVGSIGLGAWGFNEVRDNLAQENIVGTPDSSIPGQKVNTG